jgi:thioredoxin reductase
LNFTDLPLAGDIAGCIYYEVYDLLPVAGKHVAIIGGGDAAFDYALNLGRRNRVTILNRGNSPKCLPLLAERVQLVPEITYLDNICAVLKG